MQSRYYINSLASTIGGAIAAGSAIALLTRDAQQTGWTYDHSMMIPLVGLTILFGHESLRALKEFKIVSCTAFLALAVFGSSIVISETMGRRAESRDAKVSSATKDVDQYASLLTNLDKANKLAAEAEGWVANECKTGLGPKCRGVTFTRDQRLAYAEKLRKDAEAHKAPAPVDSKADRVAAVAALLGFRADVAKKAVHTFEPFVLPLFLELGAIFLFGFGVQHRKVTPVVSLSASPSFSDSVQTSFSTTKADDVLKLFADPIPENDPEPPKPRKTKKPTNVVRFPTVKHPVLQVLETSGRTMSNGELAKAMGVSDSEASKRWQEVAELLEMGWNGKFRTIGLKAWKATA